MYMYKFMLHVHVCMIREGTIQKSIWEFVQSVDCAILMVYTWTVHTCTCIFNFLNIKGYQCNIKEGFVVQQLHVVLRNLQIMCQSVNWHAFCGSSCTCTCTYMCLYKMDFHYIHACT